MILWEERVPGTRFKTEMTETTEVNETSESSRAILALRRNLGEGFQPGLVFGMGSAGLGASQGGSRDREDLIQSLSRAWLALERAVDEALTRPLSCRGWPAAESRAWVDSLGWAQKSAFLSAWARAGIPDGPSPRLQSPRVRRLLESLRRLARSNDGAGNSLYDLHRWQEVAEALLRRFAH